MEWGGRILMSSTAKDFSHLRAVEQVQQSLQGAPIACAGVELEGKSASIKSSSECIQSSNAISFSSCFVLCSEPPIAIQLIADQLSDLVESVQGCMTVTFLA